MDSFLNSLAKDLERHFSENPDLKLEKGEQYFRGFINENRPKEMNDEDDFVEKYFDQFQDYLSQFDWVKVDKDSQRWLNLKCSKVPKKTTIKTQVENRFYKELDKLKGKSIYDKDDIEIVTNAVLDENLSHPDLEQILYIRAESASELNHYTKREKAVFWVVAAEISSSEVKLRECYEKAADQNAKDLNYEGAANQIEKCIFSLKKTYARQEVNFLQRIKNRIEILTSKLNRDQQEELLRYCRKFRMLSEQAGLRDKASIGFVYEYDTLMQTKGKSRLLSWLYWFAARYGESPFRVLFCCFIFIFIFAASYNCMGIIYNLSGDEGEEYNFITNLYFSIVTSTTLGYGDFSPPVEWRLLASFQALIGLFMTSLFLVTFVRRFSR